MHSNPRDNLRENARSRGGASQRCDQDGPDRGVLGKKATARSLIARNGAVRPLEDQSAWLIVPGGRIDCRGVPERHGSGPKPLRNPGVSGRCSPTGNAGISSTCAIPAGGGGGKAGGEGEGRGQREREGEGRGGGGGERGGGGGEGEGGGGGERERGGGGRGEGRKGGGGGGGEEGEQEGEEGEGDEGGGGVVARGTERSRLSWWDTRDRSRFWALCGGGDAAGGCQGTRGRDGTRGRIAW